MGDVGSTGLENSAMITEKDENSGAVGQKEKDTLSLSKKQLRKLRRYENIKKKWQVKRLERKQKRREMKKTKTAASAASTADEVAVAASSTTSAADNSASCLVSPVAVAQSRKRLKQNTMAGSNCRLRIGVDMSFDHLMSDKDLRSCLQQIGYCYAANRRADNPLQFYLFGLNGRSKEMFDSLDDRKSWDINVDSRTLEELFSKDETVYLTSESENKVEVLDESKVYIIGGLVDHNAHKGLCHKLAVERCMAHARLPIDEYFNEVKGRKVLTINQVFEILLRFTQTADWKAALAAVVPKRKHS